jgi:hypothetical protein
MGGSVSRLSDRVLFTITLVEQESADDSEAALASDRAALRAGRTGGSPAALADRVAVVERRGGVAASLPESGEGVPLETNIDVSVSGRPVPGRNVTVQASIEGVPVVDGTVAVGNRTYRTGEGGEATLPVPFRERMVVNVTRGDASGNRSLATEGTLRLRLEGSPTAGGPVPTRVTIAGDPVPDATVSTDSAAARTNTFGRTNVTAPYRREVDVTARRGGLEASATASLATKPAAVELPGSVAPGEAVTARATVADTPLRGATVTVDGSRVGRTGRNGTVTVTVPYAEQLAVQATRGPVTATGRTDIESGLNVSVTGLVVPGGTVTVEAAVGSAPVPNASVRVGGERVATTGPNGTAAVAVPLNPLTTRFRPTVERGSLTGVGPASPLWPYWAGAALVLVALAGVVAWRFDLRAAAAGGQSLVGRAVAAATRAAVRVAAAVTDGVERLAAWGRLLRTNTREALARARTRLAAAAARGRDVVRTLPERIRALPGRVVAMALAVQAALRGALDGSGSASGAGAASTTTAAAGGGADGEDEPPDIFETWRRLEREVAGGWRRDTRTPSEVARRAVERGYPADHVESLRAAVLHQRYSSLGIPERLRSSARDAAAALADERGWNDR